MNKHKFINFDFMYLDMNKEIEFGIDVIIKGLKAKIIEEHLVMYS